MKAILLSFFSLFASAAFAADAPCKLAFERDDNSVWVANLDGSGAKKIASGVDPDISQDGTKLAFNTDEGPGDKSPVRHIAVADMLSGKVSILKAIPSDNSFSPVWSRDGKTLLFYTLIGHGWNIGVINADGNDFRIVKKGGGNGHSFWSGCWGPDGNSIYCQDLENLYQMSLNGEIMKQWKIEKIIPNGEMNSGGRLHISPDGAMLLMDIDMGEEHNRKDWDGPPPAVWTFEIATGKSTRVTPKSLFAWESCWLGGEEILFNSMKDGEKHPSIYRMMIGGKTPKLIVKHARMPSVSR